MHLFDDSVVIVIKNMLRRRIIFEVVLSKNSGVHYISCIYVLYILSLANSQSKFKFAFYNDLYFVVCP